LRNVGSGVQEQGKDPYESSATYIEDPLLFLTANTYHPKLKAVLWTGIVLMPIRTLTNALHILENFKKIFYFFTAMPTFISVIFLVSVMGVIIFNYILKFSGKKLF
jgi:hypothetical protein